MHKIKRCIICINHRKHNTGEHSLHQSIRLSPTSQRKRKEQTTKSLPIKVIKQNENYLENEWHHRVPNPQLQTLTRRIKAFRRAENLQGLCKQMILFFFLFVHLVCPLLSKRDFQTSLKAQLFQLPKKAKSGGSNRSAGKSAHKNNISPYHQLETSPLLQQFKSTNISTYT